MPLPVPFADLFGGVPYAKKDTDPEVVTSPTPANASVQAAGGASPSPQASMPPPNQSVPPPKEEVAYGDASDDTAHDVNEGAVTSLANDAYILGPEAGAGPAPEIVGGAEWSRVGGKDRFDEAMDRGPLQTAGGLVAGAEASSKEGEALAEHYRQQSAQAKEQLAKLESDRQLHEAELQRREQELKERTAAYTKDLSNTGKFWKEPGNIISAIALVFMPLAGGDPNAGSKMLAARIEGDWQKRKQLADMHLGELRSNLAGYRAIAKDREAGDLLALSESYRMGAMEVQRISSQFQGPKAKAAAEAAIGQLMTQSNMTAMELYAKLVNREPGFVNSAMAKYIRSMPGFESYAASKGVQMPNAASVAAPTAPTVPGAAPGPSGAESQSGGSVAQATGTVGAPGAPLAPGSKSHVSFDQPMPTKRAPLKPGQEFMPGATISRREDQEPGGPGRDSDFEKKMGSELADLSGSRAPGQPTMMQAFKNNIWAIARAKHPGAPASAVRAQVAKDLEEVHQDVPKIAAANKDTIQKVAGLSLFQQDIRDIDRAFKGDHGKINDFLGQMRRAIGGGDYTRVDSLISRFGFNNTPAEAAARRFAQTVAKRTNSYYHETSGGAVTTTGGGMSEGSRLVSVVSSDSSWDQIKGFASGESKEAAAQFKNNLAHGRPLAQAYYLAQMGDKYPLLNSPGKKKHD